MERHCQLDYASGQVKRCPGDTCPFWVDDHCAVAPYWELYGSDPKLAELLTHVRSDLARRDPSRVLRQLHPPGLA